MPLALITFGPRPDPPLAEASLKALDMLRWTPVFVIAVRGHYQVMDGMRRVTEARNRGHKHSDDRSDRGHDRPYDRAAAGDRPISVRLTPARQDLAPSEPPSPCA
jgi:hypothetical protein